MVDITGEGIPLIVILNDFSGLGVSLSGGNGIPEGEGIAVGLTDSSAEAWVGEAVSGLDGVAAAVATGAGWAGSELLPGSGEGVISGRGLLGAVLGVGVGVGAALGSAVGSSLGEGNAVKTGSLVAHSCTAALIFLFNSTICTVFLWTVQLFSVAETTVT